MNDNKLSLEATSKIVDVVAKSEDGVKPVERKSWKEVLEKSKGIIEEKSKIEDNDPWKDRFDKRDEICKKIEELFNQKLKLIHSEPSIQELILNGKFTVDKTVGVKMNKSIGNANQKEYITRGFSDYRSVIPQAKYDELYTSLQYRCNAIENDLNRVKSDLKARERELQVLSSKIGQKEAYYTKNKGTELLAKDIDNDEELQKMREEKENLKVLVDKLSRTLRMGEVTLSDIREVKLSVKTKDVTISEPIISSIIFLNLIAIFSHKEEELDDNCKAILNDPILDQEVTEEVIKNILAKNAIDSMNTAYLNVKQQEILKNQAVDELLEKYLSEEGLKDVQELIDSAEGLNCRADVEKEIIEHLYDNPNESTDEMGAMIRKKDENGKQIPISNEDLAAMDLLKIYLENFAFGGDMMKVLSSIEEFTADNGDMYYPIFKNTIEPYAKQLFPNIESLNKKTLLLLFIVISCFKINVVSLLFLLSVMHKPVELIKEEGSKQ